MSNELRNKSNRPEMGYIREIVDNKLWDELCKFIELNYSLSPLIEYSKCSMQRGWNVKYKKSAKSLCTLYPMDGHFVVLIVIGRIEQIDYEIFIGNCCEYIRNLYNSTPFSCGGRWLMIEVKEQAVLDDIITLIRIRASQNNIKYNEKTFHV
ncbi:MAG: DUF3788 domain-containing protein [Ruminiclostridium sp.]